MHVCRLKSLFSSISRVLHSMRPALCVSLATLCVLAPALSRASATTGHPYDDAAPPTASLALSEVPLRSLTGAALAPPDTPYVDGISDQSLPYWDGSFAASHFADLFRDTWDAAPSVQAGPSVGVGPNAHITLARYVVQWNVMSGAYPDYLAQLEAWYRDVLALGLTPEVSLAAYDGVLPGSYPEYRAALQALLDRFPATVYVEAWDEPNGTPGLFPGVAARYTLIAQSLCRARGCTVIAGNLLDSASMAAYEREYASALYPVSFTNWGVHPYLAVKTRSASTVLAFKANLPVAGAGERIWFTEVGAYRCEGGIRPALLGERVQALDASWLVHRLLPEIQPAHVFYYEFLFKGHRPPPCDRSDSDTALYAPAGDGGALDVPRAAASYIYGDRGAPRP
jgi:hypothetical protein